MRTTIKLDDDIVPLLEEYARSRSLRLGAAISELVRLGLNAPRGTRFVNGLVVFELPPDSPRATAKHIRRLQNKM
jgi:hypothetical protein